MKQKVKRQLTKQQKSAVRRRLQKGEANIFTKQRRENMQNIKSSLEAASFWGSSFGGKEREEDSEGINATSNKEEKDYLNVA